MFIFVLGLGPICDEFRIWASNLVIFFLFLFIESLSHLVLVILFRICFASNCYLSSKVMFVSVSYHVVFFRIQLLFVFKCLVIKCHLFVCFEISRVILIVLLFGVS